MTTFDDIMEAFFFVSSAEYGINTAILCKETGQIYYHSELGFIDEIEDEDLDSYTCIRIPHKTDLNLGQDLVFEFVEQYLAGELGRVEQIFQHRGAYRRFKDLLEYKGLLQRWHDFEHQEQEKAVRQWCKENEIELSKG